MLTFISFSAFGLEPCPETLQLEGQIISFEKNSGKVVQEDRFVKLTDDLSEHMGDFRNLRVPAGSKFDAIKILDKTYPLIKEGEYLRTKDLYLTQRLIKSKAQELDIFFLGKDSCQKHFLGVKGD